MTQQQIEEIKKEFEELNRKCDGAYGCGQFPPEVLKFIEQKLREVRGDFSFLKDKHKYECWVDQGKLYFVDPEKFVLVKKPKKSNKLK